MSRFSTPSPTAAERVLVFPTKLGFMTIVEENGAVARLTFGHPSAAAATKAIAKLCGKGVTLIDRRFSAVERRWIKKLQRYVESRRDSLDDIPVNLGQMSEFQRRVLTACRRIPYGCTTSYAELAVQAGSPHAARAVGNCMAANPIPLVIPCHRVVCASGRIGAYSAPGGSAMKQRLLAMEQKLS